MPDVRPASTGDLAALTTMLRALSPVSSYRRFMTGLGSPSERSVANLLTSDGRRGAWVAVDGGAVVGHAMWVRAPGDAHAAELAAVVLDGWQGRGLGTRLLRAAATEAAAAGAVRLVMDVLAENRRVVAQLARTWPGAVPDRDGAVLTYLVDNPASLAVDAPDMTTATPRREPAATMA